MKVTEFREIADALARFATTREKASGPESKIGVQCSGGRLKLISGESTAGMIVDVMECDGKFGYYIEARPFLSAAKILPTKDTVEILADPSGLTILASGGGKVSLKASGSLLDAGFAKKPKSPRAGALVSGPEWKRMAVTFKEIGDKIVAPSIEVVEGVAYASCVAPGVGATYASIGLDATSGDTGYSASSYVAFWEALRVLEADGTLDFGLDGVTATSGRFQCYSGPYLISKWDRERGVAETPHEPAPHPIMRFKGEPSVAFTMERKNLITVVKGQSPYDEHNRITLEVTTGSLAIRPYGSESGQDVPVETIGGGVRSVRADYLGGLLSTMDAREVTVGWAVKSPSIMITAKGYERWTILMAPVTLR